MQTKHPLPPLPQTQTELIRAYFEFNHLKNLFRQGWLAAGINRERCESVAEHSFGVAILALLLCDQLYHDLDPLKVIRMALLHDFGEIYAGDFTPNDDVTPEEKQRLERESVSRVLGSLPQGDLYLALWDDFETGNSPEAQLVRQLDRLEMGLQALVYENTTPIQLTGFYNSVDKALQDPHLRTLLTEMLTLRP